MKKVRAMKIDFSNEGVGYEYGLDVASELFGILEMLDEEAPRMFNTEDGDVIKVSDDDITFISDDPDRFFSLVDFIEDQETLKIRIKNLKVEQ